MTLRPVFKIFLLATLLPQWATADVTAIQKGRDALSSHLWEVAALHFQEALKDQNLEPAKKAETGLLLAEAWLRDNKPNQALELLAAPYLAEHPQTPFWKGQSLAALGRFAEAVELLSPIAADPNADNRQSAGYTAASLQLALGETEAAIATLGKLAQSAPSELAAKTRLRQAQILIDLNRTEEARETMAAITDIAKEDQPLATFINANIDYQSGKFEEAADAFRSLVENPKNQSVRRYHASVIGLSDTLRARGEVAASADLLLNFIQENPESPQLEEIFKRLLAALPETPAISDPVLERLTQWIPPTQIPATGLINTQPDTAAAAWPTETSTSDVRAFALFTRAAGLHRINTPEARDRARSLLTRLRMEYPDHFLTNRALLLLAKWDLANNQQERAFSTLQTIFETATSPLIRGEAAFVKAKAAYVAGEPEQAVKLFNLAADSLSGIEADTARFNAALVSLNEAIAPDPDAKPILNPTLAANLKLERALAIDNPTARRGAIEEFLIQHPKHPRAGEARLKAAEAALATPTPDISFAQAQLETIASNPAMKGSLQAVEIDLIQLRIHDLAGDTEPTIEGARKLITDYPNSKAAEEASLILGRNLYQTRNYNEARIVLEKLAATVADPARAQAALLMAARSAALVPTTQSQQEALTLFTKTTEIDGPVTALAKLEKARLMIDMSHLTEATVFLREWFESLPAEDPLHLPAGLLLGEAIYAQGNINSDSLTEALKVYDQLLEDTKPYSAVYDRLQYLRGRALEQLPAENDPTQKRDKQAFIAYYSVLERDTPPEEWQYFELCGFRALALLEKARRWPAAIACAKKIASFKGPRAEEAATRANKLQLKHMIWED